MSILQGYERRTFHVPRYLEAVRRAAQRAGFLVDDIGPRALPFPMLVLKRSTPTPKATLHLSAGMHGDEPAGPLALLRMLRAGAFPSDLSYVIFPLLNPVGTAANRRENGDRLDINRDYNCFRTPEARAHVAHLKSLPRRFDLSINLHEDWEAKGCYIYEVNPDRECSIAPSVLAGANAHIPVDCSPLIDGSPAEQGIIRPTPETRRALLGDSWPETLYMINHHTRHSYTFETPSNTNLGPRISAQCAAVYAAFKALIENGEWFEI
ncbi:MAG: M14 family metallocarboxypeptidase [Verrucomicrobiota bacterium]|nr:M14 family metallocarboxypeptidase [Verrucomicrobiota bacterium]